MDRRDFLKVAGGTIIAGTSCAYAFRFITTSLYHGSAEDSPLTGRRFGMVIDLTRCDPECDACLHACREENNVSFHGDERWDVHWIRKVKVKSHTGGRDVEKSVILLCNHCDNPPCAQVCPVQATYKREDGIVIVDHHRCIGCRYCMIACPYNARMFNFKDNHEWHNTEVPKRSHGVAEACNLCVHRLDVGRQPACVEACANKGHSAIMVGDLNDRFNSVADVVATQSVKRLHEDLGTNPKVYYLGL